MHPFVRGEGVATVSQSPSELLVSILFCRVLFPSSFLLFLHSWCICTQSSSPPAFISVCICSLHQVIFCHSLNMPCPLYLLLHHLPLLTPQLISLNSSMLLSTLPLLLLFWIVSLLFACYFSHYHGLVHISLLSLHWKINTATRMLKVMRNTFQFLDR